MYTFVDIDADNNIGGEMNKNVIKWRNKNSCRCKFHLGWIVLKIEGGVSLARVINLSPKFHENLLSQF